METKIQGIYPEKKVTGVFNTDTELAVGRFQMKYSLAKPGDVGYGIVGPTTREKLKEVWGR